MAKTFTKTLDVVTINAIDLPKREDGAYVGIELILADQTKHIIELQLGEAQLFMRQLQERIEARR